MGDLFGLIHEGQMKPIALLILMLAFGYVQENAKVRLNAYRAVADHSAGFYDLPSVFLSSFSLSIFLPLQCQTIFILLYPTVV